MKNNIEMELQQLGNEQIVHATALGDFITNSPHVIEDIVAIMGRQAVIMLETSWSWIREDGTLAFPQTSEIEINPLV